MSEVSSFVKNGVARVVGITGGAGSGKSTLTTELDYPTCHMDSFFIGDSAYRTDLLLKKKRKSFQSFLDSEEQFNWWNWDSAEEHIKFLLLSNKTILVEGAILGPPSIVNVLDVILFIDIPREERYARLLKRDSWKRTEQEIEERFRLTNKSEEHYYQWLFETYGNKIFKITKEFEFK